YSDSYFFFSSRRRHTRSKRDWSSDVCSSDLDPAHDRVGKICGPDCQGTFAQPQHRQHLPRADSRKDRHEKQLRADELRSAERVGGLNSGGGHSRRIAKNGQGDESIGDKEGVQQWTGGPREKVAVTSKMKDLIHREITRRLRWYLPLVSAWVLKQERFILETGVPLTDPQKSDARLAGVLQPDQVRLLSIEQIPLPEYADSHWI